MIRDLLDEKAVVEQAISALEELQRSIRANSIIGDRRRRGRKFMHPEERLMVSERMKKYWAAKRQQDPR